MKFFIVGILEIWLDDDCNYFFDIVGYNFLYKFRVICVGGGVGFYIGEYLNYKECFDLVFFVDGSVEFLFIEINRIKEKNVIVGVIYWLFDLNLNEFLFDFDFVLEKIIKENKFVFLMGDWNLNLINYYCYKVISDFLDLLYFRMFFLFIICFIRIMLNKVLLIDNIFINDLFCFLINGFFFNDIFDYLLIFLFVLNNYSIGDKDKYVIFCEKNVYSLSVFKDNLGKINWVELFGLDDLFFVYKIFIIKYVVIYDWCFLFKRKKVKWFNFCKFWFIKGFVKFVKKKNMLFKCLFNNLNFFNEIVYKFYKNKFIYFFWVVKCLYYEK